MPLLVNRTDTQRFVALFVGDAHSGKTVAEASFPKPNFFFDFDLKIGGAQVPWLDLKDIEYESYPPKTPNLVQKLENKIEMFCNQATIQNGTFGSLPKTICVDSLTWMTFAFTCQSLGLTHLKTNEKGQEYKSGRWIGPTAMLGPEDYGFEAQKTYDIIADLKSLPVPNIIISAHLIDTYEKPEGDPYAASVLSDTKKLSVRDKIGVNVKAGVEHVFEFTREKFGNNERFYVTFRGGVAFSSWSWLPYGRQEWTGRNFYEFMLGFKK